MTVAPYPYAREPECAHLASRDEMGRCILCVFPSLAPAPEPEPLAAAALDPELAADLLRQLRAFRARASLAEFVKQSWSTMNPGTPLEWGPHLEAVCWHVQQQLEDRGRAADERGRPNPFKMRAQNLVINVPPRSLKTTILTCATVWAWLHWPTMKIAYLSANPRVAQNSARQARDIILSHWFQITFQVPWRLREDQDALSSFGNTAGGSRASRGLASVIVGEGFEWLLIDDPHDSAASADQIQSDIDDYDSSVANRINDPRASIRTLIMQRLRENDLSGHALATGEWAHVRLPMEYEVANDNDGNIDPEQARKLCPCGRCVGVNVFGWRDWRTTDGDVLHPRFTPEFLASERKRLLEFGYAGQMQQRPAPKGGLMFKSTWFRIIERSTLPGRKEGGMQLAYFCDLTSGAAIIDQQGKKRGSSMNAIMLAGKHGPNRYVIDMHVFAGDILVILALLKRLHKEEPRAAFVIEEKAVGGSTMVQLRQDIPAIIGYDPGVLNKVARAESVQPVCAGGNVILAKGPWNDPFLHEVTTFPRARHDDQMDTLSMMIDHWRADSNWDKW